MAPQSRAAVLVLVCWIILPGNLSGLLQRQLCPVSVACYSEEHQNPAHFCPWAVLRPSKGLICQQRWSRGLASVPLAFHFHVPVLLILPLLCRRQAAVTRLTLGGLAAVPTCIRSPVDRISTRRWQDAFSLARLRSFQTLKAPQERQSITIPENVWH